MTFKEFAEWCERRTCDGCWGPNAAMCCIDIMRTVRSFPFWKREKVWKETYEQDVMNNIVNPTENKIREIREIREKK